MLCLEVIFLNLAMLDVYNKLAKAFFSDTTAFSATKVFWPNPFLWHAAPKTLFQGKGDF